MTTPETVRPTRRARTFTRRFNEALQSLLVRLRVEEVPHIKRIIVTVVGGTIVILGAIMVVTPGPAVVVVPIGLAILGTEYAWARRWLRRARKMGRDAYSRTQRIFAPRPPAADPAEPPPPTAGKSS